MKSRSIPHITPLPWLLAVIFDWFIIFLSFGLAWFYNHPLGYFLAILAIGNRQHAIAILGHDGAHRLISKNKKLNDLLTNIFSFYPTFTDLEGYRKFHFAHHRHLGTPQDPELDFQPSFPKQKLPLSNSLLILRLTMDLFGGGLPEISKFIGKTTKTGWQSLCWWLVVGSILFLIGWWLFIPIYFTCVSTSFWTFFRLRTYTEHYGIGYTYRLKPTLLLRLICPHNTWAHYEHHEHPQIPFWQLPLVAPAKDSVTMFEHFKKLRG